MRVKFLSFFRETPHVASFVEFVSCAIIILACLSSCGRQTERMRAVMDSVQQRNLRFESLADDTLMADALTYFESHGTQDDRMWAHYLMGCVYRDRGQSPEALLQFHAAVDMADTALSNCNYALLSRIHGQMVDLFRSQSMFQKAAEYCQLSYQEALKVADTAMALSVYNTLPDCYYNLGMKDSALHLSERAAELYRQFGDTVSANTALGPAIYMYLERGNLAKAKEYLDLYEYHSDLSGLDTFAYSSFYLLYYNKGLYSLATDQDDSALYFFRKQLTVPNNLNVKTLAYKGLYEFYKKRAQRDSIIKYADIFHHYYDSLSDNEVFRNLQQMQSFYDYSHYQQQAEQAEKEKQKAHRNLALAFVMLFLTVSLFLSWWYFHKRQMRELAAKYVMNFIAYHSLEVELKSLRLQKDADQAYISKVEDEVKLLKYSIAQTQTDKKAPDQWNTSSELLHHPIVVNLHLKANRHELATDEEMNMLHRSFNLFQSDFLESLSALSYKPDLRETNICLLVRLRFAPSEIGALLGLGSANVSRIRKELLWKLFHEKGSSTLFDDRIRMLGL